MRVVGREVLEAFCIRHPDCRKWVANWLVEAGNSKWQVHDVLVDKRSLVQSYREYFDKTLAGTSYQDLIWKLRVKEVEATPAAQPA